MCKELIVCLCLCMSCDELYPEPGRSVKALCEVCARNKRGLEGRSAAQPRPAEDSSPRSLRDDGFLLRLHATWLSCIGTTDGRGDTWWFCADCKPASLAESTVMDLHNYICTNGAGWCWPGSITHSGDNIIQCLQLAAACGSESINALHKQMSPPWEAPKGGEGG